MTRLLILTGIALSMASAELSGAEYAPLEEEPRFLEIEPISVPIVDGDRIDGRLSYAIVLEAKDDVAMARLRATGAELRSAALRGGLDFAQLYASRFSAIDAEMLSGDLTEALQEQDPGIARVLLVKVAARAS